jgi:hypothetical protein
MPLPVQFVQTASVNRFTFLNPYLCKIYNPMNRIVSLLFACLIQGHLYSQTELFFENFNGASPVFQLNTTDVSSTSTGFHKWIINDFYAGGTINVACLGITLPIPVVSTPNQPGGVVAGPQSKYMHVTTQAGITGGVPNCHYLTADPVCNPVAENIFTKMTTDISTVGYTNITLSFWWICAPDLAKGEVYFSTNGGTSWTLVPGQPSFTGTPSWTLASFTVPAFLNQPNLRLGFRFVNPLASDGEDPAFGVDDIKITGTSATPNTITTGGVNAGPYCPGDAFDIPFAVSGTFDGGNVFTAQLSDPAGSFASPVSIGTLSGTGNGVISGTIPAGTAAGTYQVRVVSNSPAVFGSPGPISITVSAPPVATILPSSTTTVCDGGVATLNASGGGTYQWYSSATGSGFTIINGATGATYTSDPLNASAYYQVRVSNDCGEATSATWQVNLQSVVDIPLEYTPESLNLCNGPITITVVGTFSNLSWSGGETGNSITVNTPSTISVSGLDPNNCPAASDDVLVIETEPLPLSISPASPVTLCGTSVNLTASQGFTNYQWSGGGTGNPYAATTTGTFSVTATDANGCQSNSDEIIVEAGDIALIEITPENPAICPGQPVTLSASPGFTGYTWSNGATGQTLVVNQSGTFSVSASPVDGGCPGESLPVTVTKSNFPIANFTYDQGNGLKIEFENTSQNGVEYTWSFSSFGTSTAESPSFTFPDLGPFYVTLIASNGCGSDTVTKLVIATDVGFESWLNSVGLKIYPNPSAGDYFISCNSSMLEQLRFEWIDLSGRTIGNAFFTHEAPFEQILPAAHLSPGLYLLKVSSEDQSAIFRLIRTSF